MDGPSDATGTQQLSPETAFHLLGHEIRIDVLYALWQAPGRRATFSELQEHTGVDDNGQLNYHREKLTGHFIRKTPNDNEYELTRAGRAVIQAIHAGTLTGHVEYDPTTVDGKCWDCDGRLELRYADKIMSVTCTACERRWHAVALPPAAVAGRSHDGLVRAFVARSRSNRSLANGGICPICGGCIEGWLVAGEAGYVGHPVWARFDCRNCNYSPRETLGEVVLDHPAVVAAFDEQGTDLRETPSWTLPFCYDERHVRVCSTDPLRGEVTVPLDDGRLTLMLAADATVTDHTRRSE